MEVNVARIFLLILFPFLAFSQITGTGTATFFDSTSSSDAIRISMTGVSSPQTGRAYFGWLGRDNDNGFLSLGQLALQAGSLSHVYKHPNDSNLIGLVKKALISEETLPFSGTVPTAGAIVFADSLHGPGASAAGSPLALIRNCLVSFPNTAQGLGLAVWMKKHMKDYKDHAGFARDGAINNNVGEARSHADHIFDFIQGKLTGSVAGNGSVALNGDPVGYGYRRYGDVGTKDSTQGGAGSQGGAGHQVNLVLAHPAATLQMRKAGSSVLTALKNALGSANDSGLAKKVTDRAQNIINGVYPTGQLPTEGAPFHQLAMEFLNGTVGATDTASSTGGIEQAYFHLQRMATMNLNPVSVTSIGEQFDAVPSGFELRQNYPNPFNPSTSISFVLPVQSRVNLSIHDLLGKELERILDASMLPAGTHTTVWESSFPTGVYLIRLTVLDAEFPPIIRKMVLIR